VITAEYLTACVRRLLEGEDAIVLTEVVTSSKAVAEHLRPSRPGSVLHHGGGALGWSGGAAAGAKLAAPERTVVSLVGDGSSRRAGPRSSASASRRCSRRADCAIGPTASAPIAVILRLARGGSSAGQSSGLIICRSWVRAPPAPRSETPT
jgi:hypothetical protein